MFSSASTKQLILISSVLSSILLLNACIMQPLKNDNSTTSTFNRSIPKHYSDYQLLLASLLNDVNEDQFSYFNQQGIKKYDELKHFKALEKVYEKNVNNNRGANKLSDKQLKNILFFSFYATETQSAAFLEYLAVDLMTVYKGQPIEFLKLLNDLPFVVKANCNRLNAYFGFEGKNTNLKPKFLATNKALFQTNLSSKSFKICLKELN